jgi:hypothetical protein
MRILGTPSIRWVSSILMQPISEHRILTAT